MIEGIIITCFAIGSHKAYVYVRGEYSKPIKILQDAIDEVVACAVGCFQGRAIFTMKLSVGDVDVCPVWELYVFLHIDFLLLNKLQD